MPNLIKRTDNAVASREGKIRVITNKTPHHCDMVIADLSSSMDSSAYENKSRYECLQEAMRPYAGRVQVIAFNDRVWEVDADSLPHPEGMTAMEKAFKAAQQLVPLKVLLISDGCPNNEETAIEEAKALVGPDIIRKVIIDVLYIGPKDQKAEAFMHRICEIGGGRYMDFEVDKNSPALLESSIGNLLALPAPGSIQL